MTVLVVYLLIGAVVGVLAAVASDEGSANGVLPFVFFALLWPTFVLALIVAAVWGAVHEWRHGG